MARLRAGERIRMGERDGVVVRVKEQRDPYLAVWGIRRGMVPYYLRVRLDGEAGTRWVSSRDVSRG